MSPVEKCIKCEHYESICDGYGVCQRDDMLGVMVVADYEPTKNCNYCEKCKLELSSFYGEMAYQKETKTAYQMQHEGWCDDCAADVNECIRQSECEGYRRFKNEQN